MPAALDANLGSTSTNWSQSAATTVTLTTSAAAAASTRVVVLVSYWTSGSLSSGVTIGGTAATRDLRVTNTDGQDIFEVWSRPVTGGLASGSSIVVSFPASGAGTAVGGVLVGAASFSGVDLTDGGGVNTTGSSNSQTGTAWTSGVAAATAGGVAVGGAGNETASAATSTPSAGTELHDARNTAAQQGFATGYSVVSGAVNVNLAGTFTSTSTATTGGVVVYGVPGGPVTKAANAHTAVTSYTITTGWANPGNAYATSGDNVYATGNLGTSRSTSIGGDFAFPAFTTSDIPDGATINSVTVTVEWGMTAAVTGSTLGVQLYNAGTALGAETTKTTAAEAQSTQQVTTGVALADLRTAGTVKARVRYSKGNTTTTTTGNVDFVSLTVDYTVPVPVALAGTVAATSSLAGDLTVSTAPTQVDLAGTVAATSALSGTASVRAVLAGNVSATSALTGTLGIASPLAGSITATSSLAGTLTVQAAGSNALAGTVASSSSLTGAVTVAKPLGGTVAATGTLSGAITVARQLAGTAAGTSSLAGTLTVTVQGQNSLAGTVTATSSLQGALAVTKPLAGTVAATSSLQGVLGAGTALSGGVQATSALSGALIVRSPLTGQVVAASSLAGGVVVLRPLGGVIASVAVLAGDLTNRGPVTAVGRLEGGLCVSIGTSTGAASTREATAAARTAGESSGAVAVTE